jgi:hypothetical protein
MRMGKQTVQHLRSFTSVHGLLLPSLALFLYLFFGFDTSPLNTKYSRPLPSTRIMKVAKPADKAAGTTAAHTGPEPPVRILVQTLTHLFLGTDNMTRTYFILNKTSLHHWNCDFEAPKFRFASQNTQFALKNKRCFFLVDYGQTEDNSSVPILSYEWTGEILYNSP